ncbi:MAG: DsbA family protein [Hyphomicrobiales bacterium]
MTARLPGHLRWLLAASVLLLPVFFAACGDDDNDSDTPTATDTAASNATAAASPTTSAASRGADADALRNLELPGDLSDGYFLGSPDAPVTLTVFEDFQCPHCLRFTLTSEPGIVEEYVRTGKVRFEFRNLPILGNESVLAAFGAECAAAQDRFWEFQQKLFLVQADAGQLTDEQVDVGRFAPDKLAAIAEELGLDRAAFETCLRAPETSTAVTGQVRTARDLGLRSTPSFLVNGQPLTQGYPPDIANWRKLLDQAIAPP